MGKDALIIEARLSLANWKKYAEADPTDEIVYQANKMARVLQWIVEQSSPSA